MLYHERHAKAKGYSIIVGVDEAGRGSLAGPVVVAAVCLKSFKFKNRVDDSKRLTALQRENAFFEIIKKSYFGIGVMNETAIDAVNISGAVKLALDNAVSQLLKRLKKPRPSLKNTILLLDGRLCSGLGYSSKEIIGGDARSLSIAAASIIAKVFRDRIMGIFDKVHPKYGFGVHKGYGTKKHFERLARFGLSPIHRQTFCKKLEAR
ncbi:MAG: ribonuclease HII [Candidatus Omnitrophota bacterium]